PLLSRQRRHKSSYFKEGLSSREASPDFVARNHFGFARSNLIDSALDLLCPGRFHSFFGGPVIEALDQSIDDQSSILRRKRERPLQHLGNLRRHLCHGHLTRS